MIWICLCCGVPEASVHDPTLFPFVVVVAFRTFGTQTGLFKGSIDHRTQKSAAEKIRPKVYLVF